MAFVDDLLNGLSAQVAGKIGEAGQARLAALISVRAVMPEANAYDRIRLSRYVLTGSEDEPEEEETAQIYPFQSGDVLVLGPEIFVGTNEDGNDVICWQGVNFTRQPVTAAVVGPEDPEPLTGVVGPDPAFGHTDEDAEPPQTAEEPAGEREPAPSSGLHWSGRRGAQP